jgi:hypothetical protein
MSTPTLFCLSEDPKIEIFEPSFSPGFARLVRQAVVIAFSYQSLSQYLFPPECPRVVMNQLPTSSPADLVRFLGPARAESVIAVEASWYKRIQQTTLYCYEVPKALFFPLEGADSIFISHQRVKPMTAKPIYDLLEELMKRNIEIRFLPRLDRLLKPVMLSTIGHHLIQIQNLGPHYYGSTDKAGQFKRHSVPDHVDHRVGISNNRRGNEREIL